MGGIGVGCEEGEVTCGRIFLWRISDSFGLASVGVGCYCAVCLHKVEVKKLFPNELGTRVAFIDATSAAYLYNPVNDQILSIPSISPSTVNILWDQAVTHLPTRSPLRDSFPALPSLPAL